MAAGTPRSPRGVARAIVAAAITSASAGVARGDDTYDTAPNAIDVTVEGDKGPPGSDSLGRRDIRDMPGVLGDPYRGIEVQPGVTPAASGVPYYFIRGAPPGNVGYFFDDIPVPLLFHAGAGPCVIPASIVDRVDLHLGGYPARYGRLAGAVVEADSTAPRFADEDTPKSKFHDWHTETVFRTIDIGALAQGPIGENANVLIGGHYSIGTKILSALVKSVDIDYGDYQGRASIKTGPRGKATLTTFGSYDYLATIDREKTSSDPEAPTKDVPSVLLDSDFHRVDLRYDEDLVGGGLAQAAVTFGLDRSRGEGVRSATDYKLDARTRIEKPVGSHALVRVGTQATLDDYRIDVGQKPCPTSGCAGGLLGPSDIELVDAFKQLFPSRTDVALGAWGDAVFTIAPHETITPGLRIDYYESLGHTAVAVDPRLVGSFGVGKRLTLIPAIGIASQLPGFAPIPALQIGGIPGGLQRSVQASFGAEVDARPVDLRATVYRQTTFNLTDAIGANRGTGFDTARFLTRTTGDGYGLELSAKGALTERIFFVLSYTLSRSTRQIAGETVPNAYDRTHVVQVALLYDMGHNWKGGVRSVFYTGFPAYNPGPNQIAGYPHDRTRPFFRLDVRLSKRWVWPSGTYAGLIFDFQNALLAKEVFDVSCSTKACTPREIGPITIPTLAFEAGF